MSTVSNLTQYIINGAMTGFVSLIAPLSSFAYPVEVDGLVLNDHVRIPFASAGTSSLAFSYASGYGTNNNGNIAGKDITLSSLLYQPLQITDAEMKVLSPAVLERQGAILGRKLAVDVISASLASVVSTANYAQSSSYSGSQFATSTALADIDQRANTNNWPDGERYLLAGTTLWNGLMQNPQVINAYAFGGPQAVQDGKIPAFFGFQPFKVSFTLPNSDTGFACHPNALAFAMGYNQPADESKGLVTALKIKDPTTGLVIGYREWYDPNYATVKRTFDCLSGCTVGDSTALLHIK